MRTLNLETLIQRINAALAWLESYLKLNSGQNFNTSPVIAEDLCVPLLNLVFDHRLTNLNADDPNAAAADLIDHDKRIAYQITVNDTTEKIRDTHRKATACNLATLADTLTIFFLVRKAPADPRASGNFTPCTAPVIDTLDLTGLITRIRSLSLERIAQIADLVDTHTARLTTAATLHTIPSPPAHFTGRSTDLEKLLPLADKGGAVLTGLRGMGGIGKTALAFVLAREWSPRFPDARLLLDGRGTSDTQPTAANLLAQAIHAFHPDRRLPEDEASLRDIYLSLLSGRRVLLLLDNASTAAQAAPLLPPDGSALIVTSRHNFMIGGQVPHHVGRLPDNEAIALLREFHPALTDTAAGEIMTLCAGLPLALKLAGSHLALDASERGGTPDVSGFLRSLRDSRLGTLDRNAPDAGEITISESLRLSEARLTPDQRRAWHALGVFTAPFDEPAALAIADTNADTIALLVRRSLLERDSHLHRLHDLAADYCRAAIPLDTVTPLHLAHAKHYIAIGEEAGRIYKEGGENVVIGLALFDSVRPHLEAAFAWLADRGRNGALSCATPPSEPDVQVSRIRLSSW